jgi:murein tripeptide amidase MpaA
MMVAPVAAACLPIVSQAAGSDNEWMTYYEKSGATATPRYEETMEYCRRLATSSQWIDLTSFGKSPQGRDLPLLIASKHKAFTPEKAAGLRDKGIPILLIQAGIHSGEIAGKDAGLMLLRDIAVTGERSDLLDNVTLLFIPIYNVDGHERFGPHNRINQNGPEEMGWRTTANGLNLNRDFLKADAPETQAWLGMFNEWMPDFFVDCHTTDGADYQYVITYILDIYGNMDEQLTAWTRDVFLRDVEKTMASAGFPMSPYVFLVEWPNPKRGIISWVSTPRFAQGYTTIQNRPGLLIEAHMLKDYSQRVAGTYEMLKTTLEFVGREGRGLIAAVDNADARAAGLEFRGEPFPLRFWVDKTDSVMIDFLGISYESVESDLTGGKWYKFNGGPETFKIPFFNKQKILATADLPEAYIIPAEWTTAIEKLDLHGVEYMRTADPVTLRVTTYRFSNVSWQERPYEGRHPVSFDVEPIEVEREFPAGSVIVDMNQRRSRVAAHLLEPKGPDSFVSWGFFDAIFEQKEYADSYVMERTAREMLAADDELRSEFEEKMAEDSEFSSDSWGILNWFYQRTPYWDKWKDVYPVGKIIDRRTVDAIHASKSRK